MSSSVWAVCGTSRILGVDRWLWLERLKGRHKKVEERNKNATLNEQGDTFIVTHTNIEEVVGR